MSTGHVNHVGKVVNANVPAGMSMDDAAALMGDVAVAV